MINYRAPGVYFEWQGLAPPSIQPARLDIAGFVGIAERGPLYTPVKVESWTQFTANFGWHIPQGYLAYTAAGFFENGGRTCYVVRVADTAWASRASLDLLTERGALALRLLASSEGAWGRGIAVSALVAGPNRFTLILRLDTTGEEEIWRDLSLAEEDERYAVRLLNGQRAVTEAGIAPAEETRPSALVTAQGPGEITGSAAASLALDAPQKFGRLDGGEAGLWTLEPAHLDRGLQSLEKVQEVAVVAMPDLIPPPSVKPRRKFRPPPDCLAVDLPPQLPPFQTGDPDSPPVFSEDDIRFLQRQLIGHCERLKNRVALLVPPLNRLDPQETVAWRREFDSSYAALYTPWLRAPDPLELEGLLRTVPPVGHLAGIYARVDAQTGPHKPPANELLESAQDVTRSFDTLLHGFLNDHLVNVIRPFPGRGLRVAGARTLSSDSQWRYINVRRLLIMIERSIEINTQWLVFEPSNPNLWRDVDRVVRSFLDEIWEAGMLDGATAEQAYQVTCDSSTNPPDETDAGRLITVIGVQPPWPAEFVVVRIGRTENGVEVIQG